MSGVFGIKAILDRMAAQGERPAVIAVHGDEATERSFAAIAADAHRLARGLLEDGLAPGEPVALLAPNAPEWLVAALAIGAAGGVIVPIDAQASEAEAAHIIADSESRRVFTTASRVAELRGLGGAQPLEVFFLDADRDATSARSWRSLLSDRDDALPDVRPDAPAALFYTSGTTGTPKTFYLTYANIGANVSALSDLGILQTTDRALLPLPFHHAYPWIVGTLTTLSNGVAIILPESVTGPHILTALRIGQASLIIGVPRLYEAVLAGIEGRLAARGALARSIVGGLWDVSTWWRLRTGRLAGRWLMRPVRAQIAPAVRLLVSGGARLEAAYASRLEGLGWEVLSGYGLAETASMFTGNLPWQRRMGSEGKPVAGGEIRIDRPNADGIGEIQLKGPSVFAGYHANAEANAAAFTADGRFRTGDIGYLDEDGFVYVTGREKEVLVLGGGKNIDPETVEKAYASHPHIAEIAVLERNGALVAFVVPDGAAMRADGALRAEDAVKVALTSVAQRLPTFQRLSGFAIAREDLPRTRLGKYQRFKLPDLYDRALAGGRKPEVTELSAEDRAFLAEPRARDLWAFLERRFPDQILTLTTDPQLDLGLDSFAWMTLTVDLEETFGVHLTDEDVARIETLRDLMDAAVAAPRSDAAATAIPADDVARDRERWLRPPNAVHRLLGYGLYALNWLLLKTVSRIKATGVEHLPRAGPFIIAPNHASDLDPLAVAAALPLRLAARVYWGGDVVRVFASRISRFLCRVAHIYPIDEHKPLAAIALSKSVLDDGNLLVWFAEGWRSPDGRLLRFQAGIGKLLRDSGVPVVPAYIAATFEAWPRDRRRPRPLPVRVTFGAPVKARDLGAGGTEDESDERIAERLRTRVADLARSVGADV